MKEILLVALAFAALEFCYGHLEQCNGPFSSSESMYGKVISPTLSPSHLQDLPGFTRSVVERDHALITAESQVFFPLPEWKNTQGAYLITPALGAHFSMYMAHMGAHSISASPLPGIERFVFVVAGVTRLLTKSEEHELPTNGFAYFPPNVTHSLEATNSATLVIFERRYISKEGAETKLIIGNTEEQPVLETPGEVFILRKLLPPTHHYDFNVHVMDFQPGEFLNVKEVHYNQHGLLLLEGRGIYRLGEKWYPVQAGDVIWMAPFVPQWYAALGQTKSRYLLYKDVNREPLLHTFNIC